MFVIYCKDEQLANKFKRGLIPHSVSICFSVLWYSVNCTCSISLDNSRDLGSAEAKSSIYQYILHCQLRTTCTYANKIYQNTHELCAPGGLLCQHLYRPAFTGNQHNVDTINKESVNQSEKKRWRKNGNTGAHVRWFLNGRKNTHNVICYWNKHNINHGDTTCEYRVFCWSKKKKKGNGPNIRTILFDHNFPVTVPTCMYTSPLVMINYTHICPLDSQLPSTPPPTKCSLKPILPLSTRLCWPLNTSLTTVTQSKLFPLFYN